MNENIRRNGNYGSGMRYGSPASQRYAESAERSASRAQNVQNVQNVQSRQNIQDAAPVSAPQKPPACGIKLDEEMIIIIALIFILIRSGADMPIIIALAYLLF